jgi:hypothetical protein
MGGCMDSLNALIGVERPMEVVASALRTFAEDVGASVVGAYQVCCSDETECTCSAALDRDFVCRLLPDLKPGCRVAFHTVNLGARYEWGAVRIAEEHYATSHAREGFKFLLVKVNAHAAVQHTAEGWRYGWLERYGNESACCGALAGMFEGSLLPAIVELREMFAFGGVDRAAVLANPRLVEPRYRALLTAVVSSHLQAMRVVRDIQEFRPESPTVFLVVPCVTINRPGPDTEIVVGQYGIDCTDGKTEVRYGGLGDDPAAYCVRHEGDCAIITDDHWGKSGHP